MSIRAKGIKKFATGVLVFSGVFVYVYSQTKSGRVPTSFELIELCAPAAIGFVGLLEIILNRPFSEMEGWWNSLRRWQRGGIGLVVAVIAFAIVIFGMVLADELGFI